MRPFGVHGESASVGVDGYSADGVGVAARSPGGVGLQVVGRIQANTAGRGFIAAGQSIAVVANPYCTSGSTVLVTLLGDPGEDVTLSHVVRSPEAFEVRLSGTATTEIGRAHV